MDIIFVYEPNYKRKNGENSKKNNFFSSQRKNYENRIK